MRERGLPERGSETNWPWALIALPYAHHGLDLPDWRSASQELNVSLLLELRCRPVVHAHWLPSGSPNTPTVLTVHCSTQRRTVGRLSPREAPYPTIEGSANLLLSWFIFLLAARHLPAKSHPVWYFCAGVR